MNPRALTNPLVHLLLILFSTSSSLVSGTITAATAVSAAPTLLNHLAGLEAALESIKTGQIVLAAVRMRSLVPDYIIEVRASQEGEISSSDDSDEKSSETLKSKSKSESESEDIDSDDSDSDDLTVPTSRALLVNSLNSLLKNLPSSAAHNSALDQIAGFEFDGHGSLDEFLGEKEAEAALKLSESIDAIRQIQRAIHSKSQETDESPVTLTANSLARIVAKLDDLQDEYEELQELQKLAQSSKSSKRTRAQKQLPESRSKIAKIVQKLAYILDEL